MKDENLQMTQIKVSDRLPAQKSSKSVLFKNEIRE